MNAETAACALASIGVLESAGWPAVHERARTLAARWPSCSPRRGRALAPRGPTTLVSFPSPDPPAERALLAERGVDRAQHPRPPVAARVRRSVERRGRPRAARGDAPRLSATQQQVRDSPPSLDRARPYLRHAGLPVVLALSAVLNTHRLAQNGYANIFYSAGVQLDAALAAQLPVRVLRPRRARHGRQAAPGAVGAGASAKLFGFSPLSLLLPEAIVGVLAVALLYVVLARRFGAAAAFAGGARARRVPVVRRRLPRQRRRPRADPADAARLRAALRACETGRCAR